MKVLFVTHYPGIGGANQSCLHLIRLLRERHGVESIMLTPFAGPICDVARDNNVRCDTLRYASWRGPRTGIKKVAYGVMVILVNAVAVLRAALRYRNEHIDVVHCNSSLAFFGWMYAKVTRKPVVWHLREYGTDDYWMPFYYGEKISGRIYGMSDAVVAISEDIRKYYSTFVSPSGKVRTLYNGIDVELARKNMKGNDSAEGELRGFKVIFVGGINHTKNPHEVIPALNELMGSGRLDEIHFYIVGDGPKKETEEFLDMIIVAGLEEHVHLLGFRSNIWPIVSRMDVAIVPSVKEAFGRIAVECMLCGLPVLAAKAGALPEIIDDGKTGLLFDLGDAKQLADMIYCLKENPDLRERMSRAGLERAERYFSAQLNADRVFEIYRDICKG